MTRKLAWIYWRIKVKGMEYVELGVKKYEKQILLYKQRSLTRLAKELEVQIIYNE